MGQAILLNDTSSPQWRPLTDKRRLAMGSLFPIYPAIKFMRIGNYPVFAFERSACMNAAGIGVQAAHRLKKT